MNCRTDGGRSLYQNPAHCVDDHVSIGVGIGDSDHSGISESIATHGAEQTVDGWIATLVYCRLGGSPLVLDFHGHLAGAICIG